MSTRATPLSSRAQPVTAIAPLTFVVPSVGVSKKPNGADDEVVGLGAAVTLAVAVVVGRAVGVAVPLCVGLAVGVGVAAPSLKMSNASTHTHDPPDSGRCWSSTSMVNA